MNDISQESTTEQSLSTKITRAGGWVYASRFITNITNIGVMAILARQLTPATFGIVALAQVLLRFLIVIGSEGVNQYVIYDNKPGREERAQAAFWMDLTFSSVAALIGILLLPLITRFYTEPDLGAVLFVMLLRYPLDSLSKVPDAMLKKALDFQRLAIRDTVLRTLQAGASVVMALTGFGVWSLVLPALFASPLRAIIVFQMARWRPGWTFYVHHWKQIFVFSSNVIGSSLAAYTITDGDTLMIGKLLGSSALGVYNLAWVVANLVPRNITNVTNVLLLPALSSVSGHADRLRLGMERILRMLSILTFAPLIGLFVIADNFVLTVYGPQWQETILPLRIMLFYALRYSVGSPTGALFKAVGRPDLNLKLNIAIVPFYLLSIWLGSASGIVGVAIGVTVVRTALGLISFKIAADLIETSFIGILRPMAPALMASCTMGVVVLVSKLLLASVFAQDSLIGLLTLVSIGSVAYWVLLRTVYNDIGRDLASLIGSFGGRLQVVAKKMLGVHA